MSSQGFLGFGLHCIPLWASEIPCSWSLAMSHLNNRIKLTMTNPPNEDPNPYPAHNRLQGHQANHSHSKHNRFPDYVLCGSLNLHKSPVNAAALSKYLAKQWDYLRINRNGVISSQQLEINRNPEAHGGLKEGKPLTVTEWEKLQKEKLLQKRKLLASQEDQLSNAKGAGKDKRGGARGRGRSRGRALSRGARGSRGTSATRPTRSNTRSNLQPNAPNEPNTGACRGRGRSRANGRGSRGSRGRGRGRVNSKTRGSSVPAASTEVVDEVLNPPDKGDNAGQSTSKKGSHMTGVRAPRLARRNLRDQGQLPRRRGPDKPPP